MNSRYQTGSFVFSKPGIMFVSFIKPSLCHPSIRNSHGWYNPAYVKFYHGEDTTQFWGWRGAVWKRVLSISPKYRNSLVMSQLQ